MKRSAIISAIFSLLIILSAGCSSHEKLLIGGYNWDKLAIIDKETNEIEWVHQLQKEDDGVNDVELTRDGNILFAYEGGARLINKAHEVIWDFKVEKDQKQELYTATELPSGEFLLAVCAHPSRIITLNSNGEKVKEQNFDSGIENIHGQFRQIYPTKDDTYLIPLMNKGEVIELSQSSEVLRRIQVGGNPFSAKVMADGNWLVACGDGHKFVIADPLSGSIIKTVTDDDILNQSLLFVAETELTSNGNFMFANWNGHSDDKIQAKIIEIDSKNRIVWTLAPSDKITNVSAFYSF